MYKRDKVLKEIAEKRLHAIREFTELGSGFKIAMRDLEIRGAGNLLGAEQHGHMEAVGYDLYCKMLNEAVKEEKGIPQQEDFETTIDMNIDAFIPDKYITNEVQKLDIYKRIAGIESQDEYEDILEGACRPFWGSAQMCAESSGDRHYEGARPSGLRGGGETARGGSEAHHA